MANKIQVSILKLLLMKQNYSINDQLKFNYFDMTQLLMFNDLNLNLWKRVLLKPVISVYLYTLLLYYRFVNGSSRTGAPDSGAAIQKFKTVRIEAYP